jgi:hypothetical protein
VAGVCLSCRHVLSWHPLLPMLANLALALILR